MSEKEKRTDINELGEFGLIHHLTSGIELKNKSSLFGVGDDCAVIHRDEKTATLLTTDMLIEGIHFDLSYHPLKHLGYKAIIANLSDIYAMNGRPEQVTVSMAISNRFSLEALDELYAGILHACEKYEVDLVGGDTTSSTKGMVISVTAIGVAEKENIVFRHTAKPGDLICVSGDLGAAYLGLQLLEREKRLFQEDPELKPNLEGETYLLKRQLMPEARKDVIDVLEDMKIIPTSMIDISDGLSSELMHICTRSAAGCKIYEAEIPIAEEAYQRAVKFNLDPVTCALNGGEDYELLFTVSADKKETIASLPDISEIGIITIPAFGCNLTTKEGEVHALKAQGWKHL